MGNCFVDCQEQVFRFSSNEVPFYFTITLRKNIETYNLSDSIDMERIKLNSDGLFVLDGANRTSMLINDSSFYFLKEITLNDSTFNDVYWLGFGKNGDRGKCFFHPKVGRIGFNYPNGLTLSRN